MSITTNEKQEDVDNTNSNSVSANTFTAQVRPSIRKIVRGRGKTDSKKYLEDV